MNPFWMVLADLRKTLLASLGILLLLSLAFSATIAVSLFDRALRQGGAASAQEFDLVVGAPGSRLDLVLATVFLRTDEVLPLLPAASVDALRDDPRVAAATPVVFADHFHDWPLVGVGPEFRALRPSLKLAEGRWPTEPFEVAAGFATSLRVNDEFHGSHGAGAHAGFEEEEHEERDYRVVGRLAASATPWDRALLTPVESLWLLHETDAPHHAVSAILVKPKDFASAYALRAQYREGATTAAFPAEVLAGLFTLFDGARTALSWLSLAFQVLVFAAVLLSLLAALPSQARWIGLLRALGAGPWYVFLTLWLQSALVFALADAAGALLGWAGAGLLTSYAAGQTGLLLPLSWTTAETGLLAAYFAAGAVGALLPALVGYAQPLRKTLLGQ